MKAKVFTTILLTLLVALLAAGCQPGVESTPDITPTPHVTPVVWHVSYPASLAWIHTTFNPCTNALDTPTSLVVHGSISPPQDINAGSMITFTWGEPAEVTGYAAVISQDTMVIVVHPENPVESITLSELRDIYSGTTRDWKEVADSGDFTGEILPLRYSDGLDMQRNFSAVLGTDRMTGLAWLVPDPVALIQAIDENPLGVGFLPSHWVQDSIRPVALVGIEEDKITFPILAQTPSTPSQSQNEWLVCVQDLLQE
jgi:hypothetical protein